MYVVAFGFFWTLFWRGMLLWMSFGLVLYFSGGQSYWIALGVLLESLLELLLGLIEWLVRLLQTCACARDVIQLSPMYKSGSKLTFKMLVLS